MIAFHSGLFLQQQTWEEMPIKVVRLHCHLGPQAQPKSWDHQTLETNAEASLKPWSSKDCRFQVGTWFSYSILKSPRRFKIHCQQLEQGLLQNLAKLFAEAPLLGGLTWHEELNSKIQTHWQSKSFPARWGVRTSISEALFIKHNSDIVLNFEPKSGYKDRRTSMHIWHETSKYVIPTKRHLHPKL